MQQVALCIFVGRVKEKQEVIQHKVSILLLASSCICPWRDASWAPPRCSLQSVSADWSKAFNVMYTEKILDNKSSSRH